MILSVHYNFVALSNYFYVMIITCLQTVIWFQVTNTSPGVVANVLDCCISESVFKLQSRHYVHFSTNILGKRMNSPTHRQYWLSSTTIVILHG